MAELIRQERTKLLDGTSIKTYETDSKGQGLPSDLVIKDVELKGLKCMICNGVPKTCYEVDCETIVIVETND